MHGTFHEGEKEESCYKFQKEVQKMPYKSKTH